MFSDEILEKILCKDKVMKIPCEYKSDMLHAVEEVLESQNMLKEEPRNAAVHKS